jgi:DNA polymerase-3 subunit beta
MKFTCDRKELAEAFQLVAGVAPQRSLKPILTRAKITAKKDALSVEGTDFEVAVRCVLAPISVDAPGQVAVPAEKVASILREAGDDEIRFEMKGNVVSVLCSDGYFRVLGEAADNFPPIPDFESATAQLGGVVLADMMKKTAFAAAEERSRYSLNGVYVSLSGKKIVLAATDGRRLAVREEKLADKVESVSGIVPLKGVSTMRRVVEAAGDVEMAMSENMVMVRAGGREVFSRLIEGKFPDYARVVPAGNDNHVEAEREALRTFIKRAALLSPADSRSVRFSVEKDALKLSARTAEVGEAELSLPVSYGGKSFEVDFNPNYLLDVLRTIDSDRVVLELKDGECAGMIREGKSYTYVVMPLSV